MRLPLCSACPILFFVLLGTSAGIRFNVNVFVDMILSIRKYYFTASVIFVHPGDKYGDLQITHLIHGSSRLLGRSYIMTANVQFKTLRMSLRYYRQIVQPIVVVIIPDFEAYLEFTEATKTYPMSFPVWFTLFLYTPDNGTHDYCRKPIGNPFNLAFNTQMMVLCHNEAILREWYSVKGETVKIFDLGKWGDDDKIFIPLTNLSVYDRRKDMEGMVLQAVTIKDLSVSTDFSGNYVGTMYGKVLEELTRSLNFTLKIVSQMSEHGLYINQNDSWTGVMGEIISGRADFAIADMSMTSFRVRYVDFTLPLIISRDTMYIKEPGICGVKWLGYFQAFNLCTWATLITLLTITPILLSFMKMYSESRSIKDLISENFILIWGIFCQQALIEFPKRSSLRVAYLTIFLTAVLIMAHYSASLVSLLTTCIRVLPFQTIDEFVDIGTYKLIVLRGSDDYDAISASKYRESAKSFSVKLMQLTKDEQELPRNVIDGFVQICKERKIAFLVPSAVKKSLKTRIPCKVLSINTEKITNLGMILSKCNPYTGVINYHLQKFLDNGIMMRLRDTKSFQQSTEEKTYMPVRLVNVIPILAFLCGGVIISIVVLIIEKIHYRSKRKKFPLKAFYSSKIFIENN